MRIDKASLLVGGLGFLGFGILMTVAPQAAMASLGLAVPDGIPTTEIRAFYGGLELALGGLLLAAMVQPAYRRAGLWLGCISYGAVAVTRALGMLIDSSGGSFLLGALAVESVLALWFALALRASPTASPHIS
ncbi:MAG: DUF4345 family protein [Lysobacterales bacterium]